jgi:hypothetical protein
MSVKHNYKTITFAAVITIQLGEKEKTVHLFYLGTTHGPR